MSDLSTERRTRAFLRLLAGMCRRFPELQEWLTEDFGRNESTRLNFLRMVEKGDLSGEEAADGFAEMDGEAQA